MLKMWASNDGTLPKGQGTNLDFMNSWGSSIVWKPHSNYDTVKHDVTHSGAQALCPVQRLCSKLFLAWRTTSCGPVGIHAEQGPCYPCYPGVWCFLANCSGHELDMGDSIFPDIKSKISRFNEVCFSPGTSRGMALPTQWQPKQNRAEQNGISKICTNPFHGFLESAGTLRIHTVQIG